MHEQERRILEASDPRKTRRVAILLSVMFVVALVGAIMFGMATWHGTVKPTATVLVTQANNAISKTSVMIDQAQIEVTDNAGKLIVTAGKEAIASATPAFPKSFDEFAVLLEQFAPISLFLRDAADGAKHLADRVPAAANPDAPPSDNCPQDLSRCPQYLSR